jgi:phospholipid/cholesterol/gamma-HCH transport system substrate-binding protein
MNKVSREVKIGIAFILAIAILYFGISFLKGINIFKPSNSYIVVFDDVSGLTQATPVTLNGLQVGLLYSMDLDPHNPNRVVANLNLNKGVKIPKGSEIAADISLLGSATINLKLADNTSELYTSTDTIIGKRNKGLMDAGSSMMPKVEQILPKVDSIMVGLQALANNEDLTGSLRNVNHITADLARSTGQLNQLVNSLNKNVPVITDNLASVSQDFAVTSAKIKSMDIDSTYKSIDATLKNIEHLSSKLTSRDNSVGLLLNDRQLYDSINSTLNNASLLLKDVRENPQRYINVKVF